MARKFKIDEELTESDWKDYNELLRRRPEPTITEQWEWLAERGYNISRGAVWSHRQNFNQALAGVKASAEMAKAFGAAVKETGVSGMNDVIIGRVQQLQMEWAFSQIQGGDLTAEDFERFAKSMNQLTTAQQRNEELRKKFDEAMKTIQGKVEKDGKIRPEDIAQVRKHIFG